MRAGIIFKLHDVLVHSLNQPASARMVSVTRLTSTPFI
jgi:hypothetical protein